MKPRLLTGVVVAAFIGMLQWAESAKALPPNIVLILADHLTAGSPMLTPSSVTMEGNYKLIAYHDGSDAAV